LIGNLDTSIHFCQS